jgi:hypothetical protein
MAAEEEIAETESEEKKSYNFWWRLILFLFIAGPASVFAFGIYARVGIRSSLLVAMERGDYKPIVIFAMWIFGLIGTATMIFKR